MNKDTPVLIQNVLIFNGFSERLTEPMNILIKGDEIYRIASGSVMIPDSTIIIEGEGRVLTPGLIDSHVHICLSSISPLILKEADTGYLYSHAIISAERMLLNGFTSVRDGAGYLFGVKQAIDEGLIPGPRIYPSGAMICSTGGHFDIRKGHQIPRGLGGALSRPEMLGISCVVNGKDEVLMASREQIRLGSSQIKIATSGGVSSRRDPLEFVEFTADEVQAAVTIADHSGTYVMSHALNDLSVRIALENGVKSIEHGNLMEESTIRLIREKGAWLCTQVFSGNDFPFDDLERKQRFERAMKGIDSVFSWARKYSINLAWGSDIIFIEKDGKEQINSLLNLLKWFSPTEILLMVTGKAGELLKLSGERNQYRKPLGVISEGAYADLILWKNNPCESFSAIEDPDHNILLLMKNGVLIKNILGSS